MGAGTKVPKRRHSEKLKARVLPASTVAAAATNGEPIMAPASDIRIEWRRGATAIAVSWPVSAAPECARWLLQGMGAK
jgi:hypothetical protein